MPAAGPRSHYRRMAKKSSFDISTGVDLQEVDNAVNMANKEIATRYDFKGSTSTIEFDRASASVRLDADDAYQPVVIVASLSRAMDMADKAR